MKNKEVAFVAIAVLVVAVAIFIIVRARKKANTGERQEMQESLQEPSQAPTQNTWNNTPKPSPAPKPQTVTSDKWNDPTYVMASRINDSLSFTWSATDRSAAWKELAGKTNDFIRHTNNWFNGHFGGGQTMRQKIEGTWFGDKTAILNKLSSIGL